MKFNKALFVLLALGLLQLNASAFEKSKKITHSYKVTTATSVDINNKYGNISVVTWDKDSVKINVVLKVNSNNEERLDKMFDNVDFDFIHTPGFITARTIIGSRTGGGVWTDISTLTRSMFNSSSDISVDYTISMPAKNKLVIQNKYGDVYIGNMMGNVTIDMSHGNLKCNTVGGNADISISYGDATLKEIKYGKITLEYSDLNLEKAEKLSIDSKSGEIKLGTVKNLNYKARRGDYTIKTTDVAIGNSTFSNINFLQVNTKLYLECTYGNLDIKSVSDKFKSIELKLRYSDADLSVNSKASYLLDVKHRNSTITFPKEIANLNTIDGVDDDKEKITTGKIGASTSSSSVINADMDRATLNLFAK